MSDPAPLASRPAAEPAPDAKGAVLGWVKFALRWTIAIVGIVWVLSMLTIRDRVLVLAADDEGRPVVWDAAVSGTFDPDRDATATIIHPVTGELLVVGVEHLLNAPDRETVRVMMPDGPADLPMAAMRLVEQPGARRGVMPEVTAVWYYLPGEGPGQTTPHVGMLGRAELQARQFEALVPQPIVRVGLASLVRDAQPVLLALAFLVFPVTLVFTGLRWWRLMQPLGLNMRLGRAYALNMVGLFYNSFMPGSTGGDFVKAYYAGKHAQKGQRAAAWLSVFIDRVIGLITLVLIGGSAAATQWIITPDKDSAVAQACLQVALASAALLVGVSAGLFVALYQPVRRKTGVSYVIKKAAREGGRVRGTLQSVYDVADTYRRRPGRIVESILLTVPIHGTVIISAMLAGHAFGLPIPWPYYFVAVPVMVLSASMPISPQGAGVMEFFAVMLTRPQGATVSQALALAMSIRVVQILWNLTGGIFVLRGGYGAPASAADGEIPDDDPDDRPGGPADAEAADEGESGDPRPVTATA